MILEKRIEIIKIHYKNVENLAETVRKTKTFFDRREALCRTAMQNLVEKMELLRKVSDVKNIYDEAHRVEENQGLSIPRSWLELFFPQMFLHCILHKDLGFKAYKVQLIQVPFGGELKCKGESHAVVRRVWDPPHEKLNSNEKLISASDERPPF